MGVNSIADSFSRTEQVVLLGVVQAQREDATPIQTHELRRICRTRLESAKADLVGTLSEADVMRSLYALEAADIVEEIEVDEPSPTGKGRPSYALDVDPETVYESADNALVDGVDELET